MKKIYIFNKNKNVHEKRHFSPQIALDEIRPDKVSMMIEETQLYARKNRQKLEQATQVLNLAKTPYHIARDAVKKYHLYARDMQRYTR